MAYQDKVVLRYSGSSSDKDLNQGVNGQLVWNGGDVLMVSDLSTVSQSPATPTTVWGPISKPSHLAGAYAPNWSAAGAYSTVTLGQNQTLEYYTTETLQANVTATLSFELQAPTSGSATNFQVAWDFNGGAAILNCTGFNTTTWTSFSVSGSTTSTTGNALHLGGSFKHTTTTQSSGTIYIRNIIVTYTTGNTAVTIGSSTTPSDLVVTGTATVGGNLVQEAIQGFSQTINYLYGPVHMITRLGNGTWVDNGSDATISLSSTTQNHYFNNPWSLAQNVTYTLEIDVKLVTATNFSMMIWGHPASCRTFDASDGLNTTTFTTVSISHLHTTTGAYFEINIGARYLTSANITPVPAQQTVGTAILKNFRVSDSSGFTTTFASNLTATGNIHANGTLTSSDKRLKTSAQELSTEDCQKFLSTVSAQTYTRIDTGEQRCGFIAQDIQAALPEGCGGVLGNAIGYDGFGILTLDYSRLTTFLWQIAKKQQEMITDLTARVDAMEKPKKKGSNKIPAVKEKDASDEVRT